MAKTYIAREEIEIPENVKAEINGNVVIVKGPKGEIKRDFTHARKITIKLEDNKIIVEKYFPSKEEKALVGTIAGHIRNLIKGVTEGFKYKMKIVYSHFPINVKVKGNYVYIENFIGEKYPRKAKIIGKVNINVTGNEIIIEGIDIEEVSQTAANIEHATKIVGKDPRVFLDGIYVYERE
jgi:large subunit ribosomal protein L6